MVDRRQSLEAVPVMNQGVRFEDEQDTGRVVITVRQQRGNGFLARFQPPFIERTVRLDELGSFVFKRIDNQRSTLRIIEDFAGRYRVNRREATLSTVEILKSLVKRGIISIAIK
ncbi:MAG: PqqD family protein [Lentisphaerae bacterium]|nr:PqqD family protein [Lentisphaerota bacterium]